MNSVRILVTSLVLLGLIGCTTSAENFSAGSGQAKTSSNSNDDVFRSVDCGDRNAEQCFLYGKSFVSEEKEDKDYNRARQYYLKASKMGHAPADMALGWFYFFSKTDQDLNAALYYMKRAADKEEVEAYCGMGILRSIEGYPSINDLDEAESWFLKGAKERHFECTFMLANLYGNSNWGGRDLEKSYAFFLISTAFQDKNKNNIIGPGPQQHMARLRKKLSSDEEYSANQWAAKWIQKNAPFN